MPEARLSALALKIGADVPFCAAGGTALCLNKGEVTAPLPPFSAGVLIVKPDAGVSTAEAYRRFDEAPALRHPDNDALLYAFAKGDYRAGLPHAANLFEQLTDVPEGEGIKAVLRARGAYHAAMSGSGSAYFGLFDSPAAAAAAKAAFGEQDELFVYACETAARGVEQGEET